VGHPRGGRRGQGLRSVPRRDHPARDGKAQVTDGPAVQTPEQLGGYYLVDGKDLDEALELAAKVPGAKYGTIEVRPVLELG
jgi:hypothetical protein